MASASADQVFAARAHSGFAPSSFEDPAFQPDSGYMFEEGDEEDFRNMHQAIGLHLDNLDVEGMDGGTMDPLQSQFNRALSDGHSVSTQSPSNWQVGHTSAQNQIVEARRDLVTQNYGQITPPNDSDTKSPTQPSGVAASKTASLDASIAKSERARNAANQRHARKNQSRKASVASGDSPLDEEGSNKREKYREKNRLAAAKCRAKKKTNTEDLESQARAIQGRNRQLKEEELNLRDELSFLRNYALEHVASGCQNNRLLSYNQMKAEAAARTAQIGYPAMQSPSIDSSGSAAASPGSSGVVSRSQSFSGRRPSMHQLQSHLFGSAYDSRARGDGSEKLHSCMSPLGEMDHSMFDFARPTTQQALASFYAATDNNELGNQQQTPNGQS